MARTDRSAPPRRGVPRPSVATLVGAAFALWGLYIGLAPLADNSLFTHIATGRLLVDGHFPRSDPYTFTALGTPWVVQSWLVSLLYGALDNSFGGDGIRLVAGLVAATLAVMVWQLSRPAKSLLPRIALCALVVGIGGVQWSPRPLLFGLVFMAIALLVAEKRVPAPVMLPVMWLWVNAHGSFPLGLVALACLAIGARLDHRPAEAETSALKWAAGGTVLGVVGPLGLQALAFPVKTVGRQDVLRHIIEWQSPQFDSTWSRLFLLQIGLVLVALVRKPSWRAAIPALVFIPAALLASRNIAVASLVLVPGTARGLRGVGQVTGDERGPVVDVALIGLVVAMVAAVVVQLGRPAWDTSAYPVDALAWMDQSGMLVPEHRLASRELVGNYLELTRGPELPVFVDDRVDMLPTEVVADDITLTRASPGWRDVLDRWHIDVVLWERTAPLSQLVAGDADWAVGYQDDHWVVACRRSSGACPT